MGNKLGRLRDVKAPFRLTPAEKTASALHSLGLKNREVAHLMGVSMSTVAGYLCGARQKTQFALAKDHRGRGATSLAQARRPIPLKGIKS